MKYIKYFEGRKKIPPWGERFTPGDILEVRFNKNFLQEITGIGIWKINNVELVKIINSEFGGKYCHFVDGPDGYHIQFLNKDFTEDNSRMNMLLQQHCGRVRKLEQYEIEAKKYNL